MRSLLWMVVFAAATTVSVAAQSGESVCSLGSNVGTAYGAGFAKGTAYTLKARSSFEQRLVDGSYVRSFAVSTAARDGAGRNMSQWPQGCYRGEDGQMKLEYMVNVYDAPTKSSLNWTVRPGADKIARGTRSESSGYKAPTAAEMEERRKEMAMLQPAKNETKTEDLGMKIVAGLEAHGTRTTRTIPVGEEGNEVPLVIVNEMWRNEKTGLTMLAISDDPRHGKVTYEVEELTQGEPDASLFMPPADYRVEYRKTVVEEAKPETAIVVDGIR